MTLSPCIPVHCLTWKQSISLNESSSFCLPIWPSLTPLTQLVRILILQQVSEDICGLHILSPTLTLIKDGVYSLPVTLLSSMPLTDVSTQYTFFSPLPQSPYQWLVCKTPCSLIILSWIQVIQHIRIYWENRQTREYRHKIPLCQKAWTGQLFLFWSVNNYRGPGQRGFARQRRGN